MKELERVVRERSAQDFAVVRENGKTVWWQHIFLPFLLTVSTVLVYLKSLHYPFQFDDVANISKKFAIRSDNPLARWWQGSRWLGDWLNRINYEIGRFDPFSYRLVNLAIHITTGLFLFYLVRTLCLRLSRQKFFVEHATLIGFVTSALFLLHPIQTQTVSYVIQARIEGLASCFAVMIIFFFVHSIIAKQLWVRLLSMTLLFAWGLLSWGTKEMIVVVPVLLWVVDWFFMSQESWDEFKTHIWLHVLFDLFFIGITLHYMSPKYAADVALLKTASGNNRGNVLTTNAYDIITPFQFFYSEFKVVLHYIVMFFWPFNASVEYDWRISPGFFSFDALAPLFCLLILYGSAFYVMLKKRGSFFFFGLLWFLICVAPRSSIIPSPELVCDYKTYLASVGLLFVIAVALVFIVKKVVDFILALQPVKTSKMATANIYLVVMAVIFLPIGIAASMHNKMWESCITFWAHNIESAPTKARVYNNYGVALNEAGRIDESIKAYQKAIDLDKYYSDPLSNIAVAYCLKNEIDKAIDSLRRALTICPNYPEAYNNLGTLFIRQKRYDEAERMLAQAISLRGYYGKAYYNLGRLYLEKNQPEVAWNCFKKAVEGDLDTPDGFFTFGQMSMQLKKFPEAAYAFEQIIARGCTSDQVLFGLANANYMLGNYPKAEALYTQLAKKDPLEARYTYNLAETLFAKKDYVRAIDVFKKATTLPKPLAQAFFRVAACHEKLQQFDQAHAYLAQLLTINAPENFKKVAQQEMMRIDLQAKVVQGNGSIKLSALKQTLALNK